MNFKIMFQRLNERAENRLQAWRDLFAILDIITERFPDMESGYCTERTFMVRRWFSQDGAEMVYEEINCHLMLKGGNAVVITSPCESGQVITYGDVSYVNVRQLVGTLNEFVSKLVNVETFSREAKILAETRKALEKEVS